MSMDEDREVWIVDRVESGVAVLVEDSDDEAAAVIEMAAHLLGDLAVEGAILVVPLGTVGDPVWDRAERDTASEEARRAEAERMLRELKTRDPGGDVSL